MEALIALICCRDSAASGFEVDILLYQLYLQREGKEGPSALRYSPTLVAKQSSQHMRRAVSDFASPQHTEDR